VPRSVLFLALGETEVPAFRALAGSLEGSGIDTTVATWLPRLAEGEVVGLARRDDPIDRDEVTATLAAAGIADPSMAADYDRDWFFGSVAHKRRHVERVFASLAALIAETRPEVLVSSVGGETPRIVAEAIAARRGARRLYFNALPIPRRFVLLPALDSPFLAWQADGRPLPTGADADVEELAPIAPAMADAPGSIVAEGLQRAVQLSRRERVYPPTWMPVKVGQTLRRKALGARSAGGDALTTTPAETRILYPLHDERDFQVAVRERHALPQEDFLLYVSSVLDPGRRLFVKPHPQHAADHHPVLWRRLRQRPNISFLPADLSATEAIAGSDVVLTLASSLGFEALQVGKPVVCYGTPFYSHRGLTTDVADVRDVATALSRAIGRGAEISKVEALSASMEEQSWPGQFTPLDLGVENLALLAHGLRDAMGRPAA
jgi:Capsule polysaccharide biosynthesis protein